MRNWFEAVIVLATMLGAFVNVFFFAPLLVGAAAVPWFIKGEKESRRIGWFFVLAAVVVALIVWPTFFGAVALCNSIGGEYDSGSTGLDDILDGVINDLRDQRRQEAGCDSLWFVRPPGG